MTSMREQLLTMMKISLSGAEAAGVSHTRAVPRHQLTKSQNLLRMTYMALTEITDTHKSSGATKSVTDSATNHVTEFDEIDLYVTDWYLSRG